MSLASLLKGKLPPLAPEVALYPDEAALPCAGAANSSDGGYLLRRSDGSRQGVEQTSAKMHAHRAPWNAHGYRRVASCRRAAMTGTTAQT